MVSTCVDPVLPALRLLGYNVEILQRRFRLVRTFLLSVRKWGNSDVYLKCNDERNVSLQSLVSSIEATVKKCADVIRNKQSEHRFDFEIMEMAILKKIEMANDFENRIRSIRLEITKAYTALLECSSLQSGPGMSDDELVELVDSIIQNLEDLRSRLSYKTDPCLHAGWELEAFEGKLEFLKNLVRFSILRGVELGQLEDLLTRIHVVSLNASRLCCTCDAIEGASEICSLISDQIPKIEPFDLHLSETCIKILGASKSSANLQSVARDEDIMRDFNDSLIRSRCDIIVCNFEDKLETLYTGLKFLSNILWDPQVKMDQLNKKIGPLLSEAGIIVCSLSVNQVKDGGVNSQGVEGACDMFNSGINPIKDQISPSSMTGGLPSYHSFKGHQDANSYSLVPSKRKRTVTQEVVVGFDDEAETIVNRLVRGSIQLENIPIVGMPGIGKTTLAKKVNKNASVMSHFHIPLIKNQINGSSITGGLPSYHSFKGHEVANSYSLVPSKRKITVTQEIVVGFDDEAETIVNRLVGGSTKLEVIPIVGMPGIGKTTLAKTVNKDPSVTSHFHICLWCCVSQVYDKKNLMLQLLCDDDKCSGTNDGDLLQRLYQKLKGQRYLVVFDDVWDIEFWHDLRFSFPNDENGSRILFTSRFSDVASKVEFGKEPHNLRSLTERESWELLQKMVCGNEDCTQELCELGKKIAKNCWGLPLTIVIIAGVLATIEHDGWEDVANRLASTIVCDTDLCKNTLQMSYEHLPHYLKPCFLYFGAFPEDREIETEKLMRLWIAQEFVQNTEPRRLEDVAEDYMMDLIGRNLVMVSKEKSTGGVKACHIHDLLHEFCKSKAKEENFLLMLQGGNEIYTFIEPPGLERLSIFSTIEDLMIRRIFCSNLSSLLLFNQGASYARLRVADIVFICCVYKRLRVLDLAAFIVPCKVFPVEINELVQLRYLAIQGSITEIPPSVSLSNLETFIVETRLMRCVSLPEAIWNMKKLRHLHIGWCDVPEGSLDNASSLPNLVTFSDLNVSSGKSLDDIVKKIPNVRKLKITLSQAKQSTNYCTLSLGFLIQLESLESLKVWSDHKKFWDDLQFCFPQTLKKLTLGYLYLPWSKISLVENLPNLEVLKLLTKSFEGESWDMKVGGFRKLRLLLLKDLDVVEWTDTDCDGNCFPSLEKLQLVHLSKLEMVPDCLGTIGTLKTIKAKGDNKSVQTLVREIEEKQKNYGNENLEVLIA